MPITVTYLPEDPDKHWAGSAVTEEVVAEATRPNYIVIFWPAILFGSSFIANEVQLRRRRAGQPPAKPSTRGVAYILAIAFYLVFVGGLFDADVRAVVAKAFGPRPLGMPGVVFAVLLLTILYLPALHFIPHIAVLVTRANPQGEFMSRSQSSCTPTSRPAAPVST